MRKVVVAGVFLVCAVEVCALALLDRSLVLWVTGAALALVLPAIPWFLAREQEPEPVRAHADESAALRRWLTRTETLISWSDSTRSDWDRRLRPMLARQFELATGQRKGKDPTAYRVVGRMLFGAELWQWVDPENVSRSDVDEPGPGRAALHDILQRLERI